MEHLKESGEGRGNLSLKKETNNSATCSLIGRKRRCKQSFCPRCGIDSVRRGLRNVVLMVWQQVRCVTLTLDRELYETPHDALKKMEKERSAFIRRIERAGHVIKNYQWFLEWHRDGYPHIHFFIETNKEGRAGMIGEDVIHKAWPYGRIIREEPVRTKVHWDHLIGYAQKHGYMHGEKRKEHQTRLPEWAKDRRIRIRRTGGCVRADLAPGVAKKVYGAPWNCPEDGEDFLKAVKDLDARTASAAAKEIADLGKRSAQTNGERIEHCGDMTYITLRTTADGRTKYLKLGLSRESYAAFKMRGGSFQPGAGHVVDVSQESAQTYYYQYIQAG